ncbi:MAG: FkbM family methyltransferase [Nitrospira sp.]|nr:FkbM family methyltransferase [Nitrospira sp.]
MSNTSVFEPNEIRDAFQDLLAHKHNIFSQNGEDGIIARIFNVIGRESSICCEFGAWDGIHLSNCRELILNGWQGIMIEGDASKYEALVKTYAGNTRVRCINQYVDVSSHLLVSILKGVGVHEIDFLSIDIDGLDYEIFSELDLSPRVICVEVNAGHSPRETACLPKTIARGNIGQPLGLFSATAKAKGYGLVCYTGNAFYVRMDLLDRFGLGCRTDEEAYADFLSHLSEPEKEWLYLVGRGLNPPYYDFCNPFLGGWQLGISLSRRMSLLFRGWSNRRRFVRGLGS